MSSTDLSELVSNTPPGPARTGTIAAWIQSLYQDRSPPVLVGGAAIELYTGGAYTTGDLDFVGTVPESVAERLRASGFHPAGRHWIHDDLEIFVEFPDDSLDDEAETATISTGDATVLVLSPEDLIVDRLAAWVFWSSDIDAVNAHLLLRELGDRIDRSRLRSLARARDVSDALDSLFSFTREMGEREPGRVELLEWARGGPS